MANLNCERGFFSLANNLVGVMLAIFVLTGSAAFIAASVDSNDRKIPPAPTPSQVQPTPTPEPSPTPTITADSVDNERWMQEEVEIGRLVRQQQIQERVQSDEVDCRCGDVVKQVTRDECSRMICCPISGKVELLYKDDCLNRLRAELDAARKPSTPDPTAQPTGHTADDSQELAQLEQQLAEVRAKAYTICAEAVYAKYGCLEGNRSGSGNGYCLGETAALRAQINAELAKCSQ